MAGDKTTIPIDTEQENNLNINPEDLKEKIKKKDGRGRPKKVDSDLRKKEDEIKKVNEISQQIDDIIPMVCSMYNDITSKKVTEPELLKIIKLSDKQINNIKNTFKPVAIKYNWFIGNQMPEAMLALTVGLIGFEKITLFREYKKIKESNQQSAISKEQNNE